MNNKEQFHDNTYSLAKGLHHINLAKQYLEDVRLGTKGEIKMIFNQYVQKCDWILDNLRGKLTEDNKKILDLELSDSMYFEAVSDKLIRLVEIQRDLVEKYIDFMIINKLKEEKDAKSEGEV